MNPNVKVFSCDQMSQQLKLLSEFPIVVLLALVEGRRHVRNV